MVSAGVLLLALVAVVAIERLCELYLAHHNARWARSCGAQEFGAEHYPAFFVLHSAWLIAWPLEAWAAGPRLASSAWVWLLLFLFAQALRYSAIASLGWRWNTRILVLPGTRPIRRGPYRWIAHPNYIAVVLELATLPLAFCAVWTAGVIGVLNAVLLLAVRIPAERRALDWAASLKPPE